MRVFLFFTVARMALLPLVPAGVDERIISAGDRGREGEGIVLYTIFISQISMARGIQAPAKDMPGKYRYGDR